MSIPVICDRCRSTGIAGEGDFTHLGDLLDFTPVPRKTTRVDGWNEERQRAFIAAQNGSMKIAQGVADAAARNSVLAHGRATSALTPPSRLRGMPLALPEDPDSLARRVEEARDSISKKLLGARRLYLQEICDSPGKRAAFEILTGYPIDWEKAARLEPQDDEPYRRLNMRQADMLLTGENGWLGDMAHGDDKMAELRAAVDEHRASEGLDPLDWEDE